VGWRWGWKWGWKWRAGWGEAEVEPVYTLSLEHLAVERNFRDGDGNGDGNEDGNGEGEQEGERRRLSQVRPSALKHLAEVFSF
jgi:hypothetical protein